jgi:predicted ArsR family transcriptional regulator
MRLGETCHDDSPTGRILKHLQQFGACSMKEMISALGVTRTAVRQPLATLMAQGLVTSGFVREGRGRPPLVYQLSDKARKLASPWLESLALVMLEEMLEPGASANGAPPSKRLSLQLGHHYTTHLDGKTPDDRLAQLRKWLAQHGIPSDLVEAADAYEWTTYGCPYYGLAAHRREVCQVEIDALGQALGAPLALVQSQLDGHHGCCFRMQKAAASENA